MTRCLSRATSPSSTGRSSASAPRARTPRSGREMGLSPLQLVLERAVVLDCLRAHSFSRTHCIRTHCVRTHAVPRPHGARSYLRPDALHTLAQPQEEPSTDRQRRQVGRKGSTRSQEGERDYSHNPQVCTSTWRRRESGGCRSTRRTASTARRATSSAPRRTSTGSCPRGGAGRRTPACERGGQGVARRRITEGGRRRWSRRRRCRRRRRRREGGGAPPAPEGGVGR
mmetsp:Transcript_22711/g.64673  ORF Transcript_22711/g.64673 Transcript_22711/m.64673 type:complete len:227 (+) Transcript_22711:1700-2380(+)